ncbi:KOW domain-containing RNA-binding protein [Blautia liquoris]|jgi:ribosomal protein L14E/L6E/L27E|uniref:KOW domain-containing RNA-binding protein n=1 Tax=Blautia liquoris TaxID=2779518 RepID=A0A7M2RHH2_9FIRM|nr:KOW domain-containing RNA-binding protein [Blautia liquoris]QOV19786.1 KOW domain-containing RNA-binding protein [Blautia liquoris]
MRDPSVGMFARSLAGHDKGRLYIIIKTDDEYLYLADGKNHTVLRPKKKKRKHIQHESELSEIIGERIAAKSPILDEDIIKAMKTKEV